MTAAANTFGTAARDETGNYSRCHWGLTTAMLTPMRQSSGEIKMGKVISP